MTLVACPGCAALFAPVDGPTHAYVGASASCWAAFGELSVRELGLGIAGPARLSAHVYMVQHPGTEGRREAQSVGVHLMVLGSVLERGLATAAAVALMGGWLRGQPNVPWLQPPAPAARTIQDLPVEAGRITHEAAVRTWAEAVWSSWSAQHATIRRWLDRGAPG